jgi:hypothetical protein
MSLFSTGRGKYPLFNWFAITGLFFAILKHSLQRVTRQGVKPNSILLEGIAYSQVALLSHPLLTQMLANCKLHRYTLDAPICVRQR